MSLQLACSPPTTPDVDPGTEQMADTGRFIADARVDIDTDALLVDGGEEAPELDMAIDPDVDRDGDGVNDVDDAFPEDRFESVDTDMDGVGDNSDAFPSDSDESADTDGDGIGDNADAFPRDRLESVDSDGDGVGDNGDQYPNDPQESVDSDEDGIGDFADTDDDNDGLSDEEELSPGADCKLSNPLLADSDGDGILDHDDQYPLDQFAEILVRRRADQRIDIFLSNRDGTFADAVVVGEPVQSQGRTLGYEYFSVADFDGDGVMDFIANSQPLVEGEPTRNVYLFTREVKADEFTRRLLGTSDIPLWGVVADMNHDYSFDIVYTSIYRPNNVRRGSVTTFLNNHQPDATCLAGDTAEAGCFFVKQEPLDITGTVGGQWVARSALQAVNLNPDDDEHLDLTLATYASGGNARTPIYALFGNGDGSFAQPVERFVHNQVTNQAPANTIMFADFNADGVGDVHVGFDDDGLAGASWTYFGLGNGSFSRTPLMALDINPDDLRENTGGEYLGRENSGQTFDFDFDGFTDLVIGVHHVNYDAAGQTRLYRGVGDGSFDPDYTVIGQDIIAAGKFAIPQPMCPNYAVNANQ
jgi:hypothetical protein